METSATIIKVGVSDNGETNVANEGTLLEVMVPVDEEEINNPIEWEVVKKALRNRGYQDPNSKIIVKRIYCK